MQLNVSKWVGGNPSDYFEENLEMWAMKNMWGEQAFDSTKSKKENKMRE